MAAGLTNNSERSSAGSGDQFLVDIKRIICDEEEQRTTVMIRNIPNKYTQQKLLETLDSEGQQGRYDFLYLPIDQKNNCNVGYAFINFVSPLYIVDLHKRRQGQRWRYFNSNKVCDLRYGRIQGRRQLERNFSTMQNSNEAHGGTGKVRPFIAERSLPSADADDRLRQQLFKEYQLPQRDSSDDEEAKATRKERLLKMPGKKATIRLHAKLGPQAVYRKKESGAISSDGHNEKMVNKRDIVASGGDYDDGASFANDYGDAAAHESPSRFGDGHQNKSAFKPRSEQFAAPLGKDGRRFKRGGSGHAAKKA